MWFIFYLFMIIILIQLLKKTESHGFQISKTPIGNIAKKFQMLQICIESEN